MSAVIVAGWFAGLGFVLSLCHAAKRGDEALEREGVL